MTVWRVIRKGSGIRSHHYFLLLKITGPNLFGPYFSVIFGLTGPICARALKSLHLLELRPRGHHDWPVMPTTQELAFAAPSNRLRIGVFGGRNDNSASWPVSNDSIRSNRVTS